MLHEAVLDRPARTPSRAAGGRLARPRGRMWAELREAFRMASEAAPLYRLPQQSSQGDHLYAFVTRDSVRSVTAWQGTVTFEEGRVHMRVAFATRYEAESGGRVTRTQYRVRDLVSLALELVEIPGGPLAAVGLERAAALLGDPARMHVIDRRQ